MKFEDGCHPKHRVDQRGEQLDGKIERRRGQHVQKRRI